jgi:hypothetical protein
MLGVALPALAAAVLPAGTVRDGCGETSNLGVGSLFFLLIAGLAIVSLRGSLAATAAIGAVAMVTAIGRAILLTSCDSGPGLIGAVLLFPAGVLVLVGDPLLHVMERRYLVREVDPVVATARVHRR